MKVLFSAVLIGEAVKRKILDMHNRVINIKDEQSATEGFQREMAIQTIFEGVCTSNILKGWLLLLDSHANKSAKKCI